MDKLCLHAMYNKKLSRSTGALCTQRTVQTHIHINMYCILLLIVLFDHDSFHSFVIINVAVLVDGSVIFPLYIPSIYSYIHASIHPFRCLRNECISAMANNGLIWVNLHVSDNFGFFFFLLSTFICTH